MIPSFPKDVPFPPRLTMDAYADLISRNLQGCSRERIARQKAIEERITARFRLIEIPSKNPLHADIA